MMRQVLGISGQLAGSAWALVQSQSPEIPGLSHAWAVPSAACRIAAVDSGLKRLRQQAPRRLQRLWRIHIMNTTGINDGQRMRRISLQHSARTLVATQGH